MRKALLLAGLAGATAAFATTPAGAQWAADPYAYQRDYNREVRECNRELSRTFSRSAYYRELAECQRELQRVRYLYGGGAYVPRGYYNPGTSRANYPEYRREYWQEVAECNRELRRSDSRREYIRELRECQRELTAERMEYARDTRRYFQSGYYAPAPAYYPTYYRPRY